MTHKVVDAIGQACPMPVVLAIQTRKELDAYLAVRKGNKNGKKM